MKRLATFGLLFLLAAGGFASAFDTSQTVTATPITSLPFTISTSGNYFLPANLTASSPGASIVVNADQVTIDLNGRSINASGVATNPFAAFGIYVPNHSEVTVQNGHINGFGYAGIIYISGGNVALSQKNRIEHVDFDKNLLGAFVVNSSNTLIENCLFSTGAVGIYDVGGVGDRFQKCDFASQKGISQLNEGIGIVSVTNTTGGTLTEDCLFSLDQTAGLVLQGPNDKFRFNTFIKDAVAHTGGTEENAGDL